MITSINVNIDSFIVSVTILSPRRASVIRKGNSQTNVIDECPSSALSSPSASSSSTSLSSLIILIIVIILITGVVMKRISDCTQRSHNYSSNLPLFANTLLLPLYCNIIIHHPLLTWVTDNWPVEIATLLVVKHYPMANTLSNDRAVARSTKSGRPRGTKAECDMI